MSTVFSKNKEKRPRSSSNETNNSFVKNVTSRVSGLLPATITKWFSSPSSSNANGSTPAADATDSSTEDEAPESPITMQPPSKRMRFSSPGNFNHFGPNDSNCVPTNIDTIEQCTPYSTVQSPPGRTTFRRETNYVSTPIRAPNEESVIVRNDRDTTTLNKSQHSVSNVIQSVAPKRKSLFDSPSNREVSMRALKTTASNTMVDPKAPCFKPSLLGSPFYPGRTMYGGASTSMYINQPNIKHRRTALVNESDSSDNTAISHSARRVMDLLENYSSPLMEAKRISQFVKNSTAQNETLNSTTISGSPYTNKVLSYKTQELHVPNIATILRLKQRSRLMDTTNAARQIIASHSSTSDYLSQHYPTVISQREPTEKEPSSKMTTKVKNRLTRPKRGESIDMEEQTVTPVNLPTAVLQIDKDNLPKFTNLAFIPAQRPSPNSTPKFTMVETITSANKSPTVKIGETDLCKPTTVTNNDLYKFSSPVRISSESTKINTTPLKFTFGSPERGIDKPKPDNKKDDNPSYVIGTPKVTEKLPIPKSANWECPDCWVSNKPDANNCVCCGAKQPSKETAKPSKCTICKLANSQPNSEKCVNCAKVPLSNNTKISLAPADDSKWKCEDCWVSNFESADKCVCCGGKNPKKTTSTAASAVSAAVSVDTEWKCDDCWIKNKSTVDKCAACGGARPGAKPKSTSLPTNDFGSTMFRTDNTLKNLVKTQSDKWECPSCLVRNENNRTKCACCDEDKPGTIKALDNKKSFNFGTVTATTFKFGIDPKAKETSSSKPSEVKFGENLAKPEESETNNNIYKSSANRSTGSLFGAFGKKPEDQTDAAKENKVNETPKLGFTFGIPKTQESTQPSALPVFGEPKKLAESTQNKASDEKEKPQEVPKIDFKLPTTKESPKSLTGAFVPQLTSQVNQEKPATSAPSLLNQLVSKASTEIKESTKNALSIPAKATSSESLSKESSFTFTGIGLKPPQNMFAAPASTVSSFTTPAQSAPTTSAMPLFQKPEPTTAPPMFSNPNPTTSTVSLFQKTETITTAAPPSLAATAPIFSFGSNASQLATSAAPQPEKPKFNFSFSNNTPALFNTNTFSATSDNSNTSKYGISSTNLGGGGNGLSAANPLTGGNGLGSGKLGGTTDLATNQLSTGSEMPATGNLFGVPAQKENLWSASNSSSNLFVSNASSNPLQKPAAFTFGSSTPFNANTPTPAFGSNATPVQNNAAPAFGSNATPSQNMFGMNQSTNAQPSMFSSQVPSQPASMFGSPQPASNPAPAMNLFGTPSVGAAPAFGTPSASIPSFEAPSLTPAQAPAFNFGAPQPSVVFGFGQQQPQAQQPQQAGVYSFGAAPTGAPQVQFTMGSAPNTGVRRVRKAFRRNPQR